MLKYIFKNILLIIPTMLGVVIIVFTINQFTPGDPVALMLGADYTEEQYAETEAALGLDDPYIVQLYNYLKNLITKLDMGMSYATKRPVITELSQRMFVSLGLGAMAMVLVVIVGVPIGIISATKQHSVLDYIVTFLSLFFTSVPNFWFAMMMIIIFSLNLGWLPPVPRNPCRSWDSRCRDPAFLPRRSPK